MRVCCVAQAPGAPSQDVLQASLARRALSLTERAHEVSRASPPLHRGSGHEEAAQADHFVPRCAIPRQCQKARWLYASIAKAASFSLPISAAFVAVFPGRACFCFDLSVLVRLAASSRKRLQETKALRTRMQMDVETVQASPALAAHLQTSPKPQVSKYYFKKKTSSSHSRNGKDDANHDSRIQPRSPLSRQSLTFDATSTYHAGAFYEIDHDKLPPKSPIHLKSIRVVKVSECTNLDITVKFPSLQALRSFFSSYPAPGTGPELDERFVMSSNHAARILRRRVAEEELEGEVQQDSFGSSSPGSTTSPHLSRCRHGHRASRRYPLHLRLRWGRQPTPAYSPR
ncbi:unnamed protein product [Miscanthus lutarioriparius]|uniref:Uncharacterized protein n=1 Tax=Miscanthus lutarioriparius TaxID=422564 RepID=A0A811MKN7_9POAL|nr:unnamed protein product [Miscanthus lutarioriparius]